MNVLDHILELCNTCLGKNVQFGLFALRDYLEQIENGDTNLEEIQNRLFYLQNLERTFSLELPELILKRDELKKHVDINFHKDEIEKLDFKINQLESSLIIFI